MDELGILSLFPVFVTLCVSLKLRNVLLGLFSGVITGTLILHSYSFITFLPLLIKEYIVPEIADTYNASVLVLLVFIGGFVRLIKYSGGGMAFAASTVKYISNKASAQISAWFGGIVIFFSDLGTPLIVGPVFQSLFDRFAISRQKLAFIIDSTSSPIAILIPFIGWGVFSMSIIKSSFETNNISINEWNAFTSAIVFQLYTWLAISVVPVLSLLGFDFGKMAEAEEAAVSRNEASTKVHKNAMAIFVWLPLIVLALTLFFGLNFYGFPFKQVAGSDFRAALASAYLLAAITLCGLMFYFTNKKITNVFSEYVKGMSGMLPIMATLVLAWALGTVSDELGTGVYVGELAKDFLNPVFLPLLTFIVAAILSFAIGSSWGTIIIMMPLAIPSAISTGNEFPLIIGAVLSGALFGDHSSPISETTILSSTGAGIDPLSHFSTQLPYALSNGVIAAVGFLIAGIFYSSWVVFYLILFQVSALILLKYFKYS